MDPEQFRQAVLAAAQQAGTGNVSGPNATDNSDRKFITGTRYMNFKEFKNLYISAHAPQGCRHMIEVLDGGDDLIKEIDKEEKRRKGSIGMDSITEFMELDIKPRLPPGTESLTINGWIHRVRIRSHPLLYTFGELVHNQSFGRSDDPLTFFRPFKFFIYYQPEMKKILRMLERKLAVKDNKEAPNPIDGSSSNNHGQDQTAGGNSDEVFTADDARYHWIDGLTHIDGAVDHLKCYIEFVDKELMHLPTLFDGTSQQKVRFSDLWYLFKPGDCVYLSPVRSLEITDHQTIWRIYRIFCSNIDDDNPDDIVATEGMNSFTISMYAIDYDGQNYKMVNRHIEMAQWAGEKDVTSLEVFPVRYCDKSKELLSKHRDYGERFQACIERKHFYYEGRAIVRDPTRTGLKGGNDDRIQHVESDILVDFSEILESNPSWKPDYATTFKLDIEDYAFGHDIMGISEWNVREDSQDIGVNRANERILRNDNVASRQRNEYITSNPFLFSILTGKEPKVTEDDYILLSQRLFAYILRERKHAKIDIAHVKDMPIDSNPFDDLKLKPGYKELVQSLVNSHFQKNKIQRGSLKTRMNQDLILGKGAGLIILLHGVPGVGKTATAEAVAQSNRKPLFVITCGDLGFTPREVEGTLTEIFRLAALWDCVLLLDEADIFLSRREKSDLKRNALVSVFLRVLEYYSGILFLTTNRVGHLDEAFKSRIHLSLYYEPLNKTQTMEIFKMNIVRLESMEKERMLLQDQGSSDDDHPELFIEEKRILNFASHHFDDSDEFERWNGRQIRNAFQVASSLAKYEYENKAAATGEKSRALPKTRDIEPVLDNTHFEQVAEATRKFSQYMQAATNSTDRDFAQSGGYRADDWRYDERQSPWSGYQKPAYGRPRGGGRYSQRPPPPAQRYGQEADEYDYDWDNSYEDPPSTRPSRNSHSGGPYGRSDIRKRRDDAPPEEEYSQGSVSMSRSSNKAGERRGGSNAGRSYPRETGRSRRKEPEQDYDHSEDENSH